MENSKKLDAFALFTKELNKIREENQGSFFTLKEIRQKLQLICPFKKLNDTNFRFFKETGVLVKAGKYYTFPTEPIYVGKVKQAFDLSAQKTNEYNKTHRKIEEVENKKIPTLEDEAIALLKSLGYKIYKPNVSYEEI